MLIHKIECKLIVLIMKFFLKKMFYSKFHGLIKNNIYIMYMYQFHQKAIIIECKTHPRNTDIAINQLISGMVKVNIVWAR